MKFILKFYYLLFKLVATNFTTKIWKYMLALNYFQMSHLPLGKKNYNYMTLLYPNKERILGTYFPDGP